MISFNFTFCENLQIFFGNGWEIWLLGNTSLADVKSTCMPIATLFVMGVLSAIIIVDDILK